MRAGSQAICPERWGLGQGGGAAQMGGPFECGRTPARHPSLSRDPLSRALAVPHSIPGPRAASRPRALSLNRGDPTPPRRIPTRPRPAHPSRLGARQADRQAGRRAGARTRWLPRRAASASRPRASAASLSSRARSASSPANSRCRTSVSCRVVGYAGWCLDGWLGGWLGRWGVGSQGPGRQGTLEQSGLVVWRRCTASVCSSPPASLWAPPRRQSLATHTPACPRACEYARICPAIFRLLSSRRHRSADSAASSPSASPLPPPPPELPPAASSGSLTATAASLPPGSPLPLPPRQLPEDMASSSSAILASSSCTCGPKAGRALPADCGTCATSRRARRAVPRRPIGRCAFGLACCRCVARAAAASAATRSASISSSVRRAANSCSEADSARASSSFA